jgi:lipoprotein LpqH
MSACAKTMSRMSACAKTMSRMSACAKTMSPMSALREDRGADQSSGSGDNATFRIRELYSSRVRNRIALAAAGLLLPGLVACSSETSVNHPSQASVTVNGTTAGKQSVTCNQQANNPPGQPSQWFWTISIGDQNVAGAKVGLDGSTEKLVANYVRIQNLAGFTGMYSKDGGTEAQTSFASDTFTITGKARGYTTSSPNETAEADFKIIATC